MTLSCDFNNAAAGTAAFNPSYAYDMATIFFNFGTDGATAGTKTYYWDNVEFYSSVGITETTKAELQVYPNPASDRLMISIPQSAELMNANYKVSDISGRIILEGKLQQNQVNVSALAKGVYTIQVITGENMLVRSFVKQ